jgi:glycosyltransferase involved in cell wall biosynthesis
MSNNPDISVVMSVYNGASALGRTVDSILNQEGASFEFVIVNDGSTDEVPQILETYARRDSRVKVINQENQGITRGLIAGCAAAKGTYIVRQDAGDISLPGRLAKELDFIRQNPDCSFATCGTQYVGPAGEILYDVIGDPDNATDLLLTLQPSELRGPSSHASTIFAKKLYDEVGGYRSAFYFAQDLDLWVRFVEKGKCAVLPDILYQSVMSLGSISGLYRKEQVETTRLIVQSAQLRRAGASDAAVLKQAMKIRPSAKRKSSRLAKARALYFVGSCLKQRKNPEANNYLKQALHVWPLHLRSAVKLLLG